jgi:hypothetical protein
VGKGQEGHHRPYLEASDTNTQVLITFHSNYVGKSYNNILYTEHEDKIHITLTIHFGVVFKTVANISISINTQALKMSQVSKPAMKILV